MNFIKTSLFKYIAVFFVPALFFTGCGVWGNFTTYFNLYYNTSDAFSEAEKSIYEEKRELFSTEELQVPGTANQLLNKVIEKASKILQFDTSTAFVDDALVMLGKAFYYQKSYQKALRKFQELIAKQKKSSLTIETRLWIGKCQIRLKEYEDALATFKAVRDTAVIDGDTEILKNAFVEEIVYYITVEKYSEAISLLNEFLQNTNDDEIKAEIYNELGFLYNKTDDIENAIASYRQVNNFSPSYEVEVRANIELAKVLRKAEKSEEALAILEGMSKKDKYSDAFSEIDLESGITLKALGRYDDAVELLTYVDTSYVGTPFAGTARYNIAEIYEYNYKNFDSAATYYMKNVSGNAPSEIIIASNSKAQKFKKYQYLGSTIANNTKQLSYLNDSSLYVQDSLKYAEDLLAEQEKLGIQPGEQNDLSQVNNDQSGETNIGNTDIRDNIPTGDINTTGTNNQLNRRPPQIRGNTNIQQNSGITVKPPVWPEISADSLKSLIVKNKFELANLFFTEFDLPDSAYYYYTDIVSNFPNSVYNARSLYGIGSYYQTLNDTTKADSIFNLIYNNYKTEEIVNAAASKLNKPVIDLKYDPAKEMYSEAEKLMMEKNYPESAGKFYNIYINYPKSEIAPKALFASGWILENDLKLFDSAAVMYDSIASIYPKSVYASKIFSKLDYYKSEKERIKKAIEDSLKALYAAADSLQTDSLSSDSLGIRNEEPVLTPMENNFKGNKNANDSLKIIRKEVQTPADSLRIRSEVIIDSLTRNPDAPVDTLRQPVITKPDSLKTGKKLQER